MIFEVVIIRFDFLSDKTFRAQAAVEYMLILTAFFAALALILPAAQFAVDQFFLASDTILAKNISQTMGEECAFFEFLGNNSSKKFFFTPSQKITIEPVASGELVKVSSQQKTFYFSCRVQESFKKEFSSAFSIEIKKSANKIFIIFE